MGRLSKFEEGLQSEKNQKTVKNKNVYGIIRVRQAHCKSLKTNRSRNY